MRFFEMRGANADQRREVPKAEWAITLLTTDKDEAAAFLKTLGGDDIKDYKVEVKG